MSLQLKPSTALGIGAAVALLFGGVLLAAPATMLHGFGLEPHLTGVILSRDLGVTLLGLAVLNWFGRTATGVGLRAIVIANVFVQVAEIVVNVAAMLTGQLGRQAVGGLLVHGTLVVVFGLALQHMKGDNGATPQR